MQGLMHGVSVIRPTVALVSVTCLLVCFLTLLSARFGAAELKLRLHRLEQVTIGLLASVELMKPNCREPEQPAKMHTWAVLRKPLGLLSLEVHEAQKMYPQVALTLV